jgi:ADP-heptose:LPS heptosyltransferase
MTKAGGQMLVAAPEAWDEACYAVPALRAMIASGLRCGVLCDTEQRDFWETIEGLAVVDFPKKTKVKIVAGELAGGWEASMVWELGWAAEACKAAGIVRRLGPGGGKLVKFLTHPLELDTVEPAHRVRHYLAAAEAMGLDCGLPEFFAPADLGVARAAGVVLLCPGSDFGPSHEWPVERWAEIGRRLLAGGSRVMVASVAGGRGQARELADQLGAGVEFFHAAPLAGALPLLAGHSLVVAADGSLPHLAAHAGTTCVTLFGPNDPAWKRPLGRRHAVVRRHVECAPCLLAKCPLDSRCQVELEVERVWEAVRGKLS